MDITVQMEPNERSLEAIPGQSSGVVQYTTGPKNVFENTALLYKTSQFSDLTIKCQDRHFHVHRAILCLRSPVIAAAIEGTFKEANIRTVEVTVVDHDILEKALQYLYTDDYDDGGPSSVRQTVGLNHSPQQGEDEDRPIQASREETETFKVGSDTNETAFIHAAETVEEPSSPAWLSSRGSTGRQESRETFDMQDVDVGLSADESQLVNDH
ncbi:Hypothetical protein D9617_49g041210 [Elsinoe fawcettii]|nr:Hypothetical protein D9617_49g041210 [Elsinoe fawcettii]